MNKAENEGDPINDLSKEDLIEMVSMNNQDPPQRILNLKINDPFELKTRLWVLCVILCIGAFILAYNLSPRLSLSQTWEFLALLITTILYIFYYLDIFKYGDKTIAIPHGSVVPVIFLIIVCIGLLTLSTVLAFDIGKLIGIDTRICLVVQVWVIFISTLSSARLTHYVSKMKPNELVTYIVEEDKNTNHKLKEKSKKSILCLEIETQMAKKTLILVDLPALGAFLIIALVISWGCFCGDSDLNILKSFLGGAVAMSLMVLNFTFMAERLNIGQGDNLLKEKINKK